MAAAPIGRRGDSAARVLPGGRARALGLGLVLVLGVLACGPGDAPPPAGSSDGSATAGGSPTPFGPKVPGRVLLIGIDGATLRVVEPMIAEGRLPNLAGIARKGVSGPLKSLHPLLSPRVWTTIATGKRPEQHGIKRWMTPKRAGNPSRFYLSSDRRGAALWNIASDAGLRVGVINWLVTYPPEVVRGVMVTDHALPGAGEGRQFIKNLFVPKRKARRDGPSQGQGNGDRKTAPDAAGRAAAPATYPEAWQARVEALFEERAPLTRVPDPFAGVLLPKWVWPDKLRDFLHQDEALARIALAVEREVRPDVLMVLFQGIDRVSHWLWGCLEDPELYPERLRPRTEERQGGAAALQQYYAFTDALIGKLLQNFGPGDLVMVVSDHGFEAGVTWKVLTGIHHSERAEDGVLFARGPGVRPGRAEGVTVADVTPTVLAWLGLAVAEDMDGRVAGFLEPATPVKRVASYDGIPIARLGAGHSGAEERYLEQLRELGYLE